MKIGLNDLTNAPHSRKPDRRLFIGGWTRDHYEPDEAALILKEKRGETEPEDLG